MESSAYISPLPGGGGEGDRDFSSLSLQPIILRIPKGTSLDSIQLKIVLMGVAYGRGNMKLGDVELGIKHLSFQYFANTPLYAMDHTIESLPHRHLKTVKIARIRVVSRLYPIQLPLAFQLNRLSVRNLLPKRFGEIVKALVTVRWKDVEIYKTNVIKNDKDPSWNDLDIPLKLLTEQDLTDPHTHVTFEVRNQGQKYHVFILFFCKNHFLIIPLLPLTNNLLSNLPFPKSPQPPPYSPVPCHPLLSLPFKIIRRSR